MNLLIRTKTWFRKGMVGDYLAVENLWAGTLAVGEHILGCAVSDHAE
jgi:hypothetical protein